MNVALKELEPFVRDGRHLQVGKPFDNFGGLRSREILANWLLCAVANADEPGRYTLATSPLGGDGVIADTRQGDGWVTEHIIVPDIEGRPRALDEAERLILEAVDKKHKKGGAAYASGKTLVVFMNSAAGSYFPNRLVRGLPEDLAFDEVWVVGLEQVADRSYVYTAAVLKLSALHRNSMLGPWNESNRNGCRTRPPRPAGRRFRRKRCGAIGLPTLGKRRTSAQLATADSA